MLQIIVLKEELFPHHYMYMEACRPYDIIDIVLAVVQVLNNLISGFVDL